MADVKISQLTEVTANTGTDLLECVQSGASRRTTVQKLLDWIKAQATTWTGKQTFQGYTVLGESAPAVKMKKLTGTTAAAQGGAASVAHGLNSAKIIGARALIEYSAGNFLGEGHSVSSGYLANISISATNFSLHNHPTESVNILSKPFRALVFYEE